MDPPVNITKLSEQSKASPASPHDSFMPSVVTLLKVSHVYWTPLYWTRNHLTISVLRGKENTLTPNHWVFLHLYFLIKSKMKSWGPAMNQWDSFIKTNSQQLYRPASTCISLFVTYKSHHFIQFVIFFLMKWRNQLSGAITFSLWYPIYLRYTCNRKLDYFFKLKNKPEKTCKVRCIFYWDTGVESTCPS